MKILIATHNQAKFERYTRLLKDIPNIELLSLKDLGITTKVDEPFETAQENAEHKAREYAKLTQLPTLAIDEATTTNFLPENEQPGVYVRRFADKNKEMTDEEALTIWQQLFQKYPQKDKQFIWDFSIAFYNPTTDQLHTSKAVMTSKVADTFSNIREKGYPMSSFLIPTTATKPYADLTNEEKLESDKKIFQTFMQDFMRWVQ